MKDVGSFVTNIIQYQVQGHEITEIEKLRRSDVVSWRTSTCVIIELNNYYFRLIRVAILASVTR